MNAVKGKAWPLAQDNDVLSIDHPVVAALARMIMQYHELPHLEIEARIGYCEPARFLPGVHETLFEQIAQALVTRVQTDSRTCDTFYHLSGGQRLRVTQENQQAIIKTTIATLDTQFWGAPFDFRFSIAQEVPASSAQLCDGTPAVYIRKKHRWTIPCKICEIMLTVVQPMETALSIMLPHSCEIEIELKSKTQTLSRMQALSTALALVEACIMVSQLLEPITSVSSLIERAEDSQTKHPPRRQVHS